MADVNANIGVHIDTSNALAQLKALQRQISVFHSSMAKSGAAAAASSAAMQQNLVNTINQTGKFNASIRNIKTTTESFTNSLERNRLSMGEYFRYAGASTKTFGRLFRSEFDTINKVARERVKTLQTQYIKMGRDANGAMKAIAVRPVALDMQNLATQTQIAAQRQALLNQLVRQGSTNLLNFGKNTQWAGRQLMVGFTVPLTMLGVVAGRTFMQLEEQAIRFKRVYGDTFTASAETDKMLDQIKQLANEFTKYGVAVEKTMEMAATAAASGKMGADLLAQVNEATRLSVLGSVEQEQALNTTISLTNAFGIATEDLANKIDFLNAVENQTVVSIEDLTIAIPKAGPVVQQLGGDVEDLAFFLTAMKEGGINASEGANALKSGLASLINPTGKAAEMLKSFGINVQGIVEANKGDVKGLVIGFASALDELDPLSRARAIEQLFGKFQFSRLSTLFKNVIQEGNQASRVLQLTKATTEELAILSERELGNIENTTTFKFKKAIEDIKLALAPVGEEFLKALTPIIEIGTKILNAFNNLDSGAKTFIVNLVGIAGVIGPAFLMTFGLIANGFANLIKMFAFIGRAFTGTKSSTTELGAATQYMTQEQLEATAVASSLDQVHAKLRQTFTSEAGAVNLLTQAYQRAVAAQSAFSVAPIGRARVPKGGRAKGMELASGIVSVPGPKGAGDIIPAMLSPGEAVIPAEQAEKYRGFIQGMIADNIPGFETGEDKIGKEFASKLAGKGFTGAPDEVASQTQKAQWASMKAERKAKLRAIKKWEKQNGQKLSERQRAYVLGPSDTAHTTGSRFKVNILGREASIKSWHAKNLMAEDRAINRYAQRTAMGTKSGGAKESQDIVKKFMQKKETAKLAQSLGLSQAAVSSSLKDLSQGISPSTPGGLRVMQAVAQKDTHYQGAAAAAAAGARLGYEKKNPGKGFFATLKDRAYNPRLDKQVEEKQAKAVTKIQDDANKALTAHNKATEKNTEAKKAETKQVNKATKNSKAEAKAKSDNSKATKTETKSKEKNSDAVKKETKAKVTQTKVTMKETKQGQRFYAGNKLAADQKAARTSYNRSQGAIQAAETRRQNRLAAASAAPIPTNQAGQAEAKPKMSASAKLGAVGAAGAVGVMGASMIPGQIGQMAQQMMMPVMMMSMILPMLTNPIALAATALAGLAVAGFMLDQQFKANIKKAYELETAMGSGTKAIQPLAVAAGNVTASEILDRRREGALDPYAVKPGKTTFGQSYVQSEAGQALKSSVSTAFLELGRDASISKLVNQMATAVMSGAVSPAQARSVVAALAQELGDTDLGVKVNAQLIELLGPNGENILKDGISLKTKLIQEAREDIKLPGGKATSQDIATSFPVGDSGLNVGLPSIFDPKAYQNFLDLVSGRDVTKKRASAGDIGSFVANSTNTLQVQKQMTDALQLEYEQKVKTAQVAINTAKTEKERKKAVEDLAIIESKYKTDREALTQENIRTTDEIKKQIGLVRNQSEVIDAYRNVTLDLYKDDALATGVLGTKGSGGLLDRIDTEGADAMTAEQSVVLNAELAAGNIDPLVLSNMLNGENSEKVVEIVTKFGGTEANRIFEISNLISDEDLKAKFLVDVEGKTPEELNEYLTGIENIYKLTGSSTAGQIIFETLLKDDKKDIKDKVLEQQNALQKLAETEPITIETIEELVSEGTPAGKTVMDTIKENKAYFDSLPEEDQIKYVQSITVAANLEGDPAIMSLFRAWQLENGGRSLNVDGGIVVGGGTFRDFLHEKLGYPITQAGDDTTPTGDDGVTPGPDTGGSGSKPEDPWAELKRSLKNVADASLNAKANIKDFLKEFKNIGNVKVDSGVFDRILRLADRENLDSDFTEFLLNADKKTRDLVLRFRDGRLELKAMGKAAKNAFAVNLIEKARIAIKRELKELQNRRLAMQVLVNQGYSMADALKISANAMYADAIATAYNTGTKKQLRKVLRDINQLLALQTEMAGYEEASGPSVAEQKADEFKSLLENIKASSREYNNFAKARQQLAGSNYSFAEQMAILSEPQLIELYLSGKNIDLLKQRIQQIMGPEFLQGLFEEGFNNAMNAFAVKQKQIEIEFSLKAKDDERVVELAQREIRDINYLIDDLNAELERIKEQEEEIKKVYDEKTKALDEQKRINDEISQQQKGQLDVLDAISSGDIAGAARAQQELRRQQQQAAAERQRRALELARERALGAIRGNNGKTRLEIETEIKNLQQQIFEIEEQRLEPAQQRLDILNDEKEDLIKSLEVLGNTVEEWEAIKNQIDLANINSTHYNTSIQKAIGLVEQLKQAWAGYQGPPPVTGVDDSPTYENPSGGGGTLPVLPAPVDDGTIPGDTKYNKMIRDFSSLGPNNKADFIKAVNLDPGAAPAYATWKAKRKSGAITAGNLDRALEILKDGNITKAEIDAANGQGGFSFNKNLGGMIAKFALGDVVPGIGMTDKVPGLLTPGEFVVRKASAQAYMPQLKAMNSGLFPRLNSPEFGMSSPSSPFGIKNMDTASGVMYNSYEVNVNVKTDANPDQIAKAVMTQIRQIDSQRIRSNKF